VSQVITLPYWVTLSNTCCSSTDMHKCSVIHGSDGTLVHTERNITQDKDPIRRSQLGPKWSSSRIHSLSQTNAYK